MQTAETVHDNQFTIISSDFAFALLEVEKVGFVAFKTFDEDKNMFEGEASKEEQLNFVKSVAFSR